MNILPIMKGLKAILLILRHDVDEDCRYALDLALIEQRYNLKSTYYFRLKKRTYVPAVIDKIADCNHEIGYHYETVDKCRGDIDAAAGQFRNELIRPAGKISDKNGLYARQSAYPV